MPDAEVTDTTTTTTPAQDAPKIKWELAKVFVKNNLDLEDQDVDHFSTWRRQATAFFRASNLNHELVAWEDKFFGIEIICTASTFKKVMAEHSQLPVDDQKNVGTGTYMYVCFRFK